MPSFRSLLLPGTLLWTIKGILNVIAFVFCIVHINRFEELTWHGIWGFPHLVFAAVCGVAFTIGTYFDPRKPPSDDLLVMERCRFWGIFAFVISLLVLNLYPLGGYYDLPVAVGIIKLLMTYVTIFSCGSLLMDLFSRETMQENADVRNYIPPKSCLAVMFFYILFSVAYILMIVIHEKKPDYEAFARGLLIIASYYLALFIVAVIAGVYREPVRRIHAMEGVVVQPPPQVAQELARNPYDGNDGNDIYVV